jgi:LPS export ABC transporter protein LptC
MKKMRITITADLLPEKKILRRDGFVNATLLLLHLSASKNGQTLATSYNNASKLTPLIFYFVLIIFSSCENDPKEIDNWTKKAELKEEARHIESFLSQGGEMRAKLTAPLMYRYQRDTVITEFPNTLHVDFFDDSTMIESWLTARYGIYYENMNKVFLRDSVTVINREGDTLRTPELWWDQNEKKFYTDKPARLDGKDKHLTGTQGLEATQDLKVIQFKYPIGPFNVKEGNLSQ